MMGNPLFLAVLNHRKSFLVLFVGQKVFLKGNQSGVALIRKIERTDTQMERLSRWGFQCFYGFFISSISGFHLFTMFPQKKKLEELYVLLKGK